MNRRFGCSLLLVMVLMGAAAPSWTHEHDVGVAMPASSESLATEAPAQPRALPPPTSATATPYVEKDRTTFFIIGGAINVLALVVGIFWAVRQWRLRSRQQ